MNDSPESITPPPLRRFRNPSDLALVTRIMLALWIGSGVAVLVADATVLAATVGGSAMIVNRAVEEAVAAAALAGFASVGTGVAFIVWTRQVYTNLEPLGAMEPRYSTGWAIAGWVVPILNYWRPKQIINDAWRAADPTLPLGRNSTWHDARVARVVDWWWALFLASSLGIVATVVLPVSTGTAIVATIVDVVRLGAAVLAATVVARLSRRQTARNGALRASWWGEPLEPATSGRRWWPAVAVGSTILALGWSLIPFPQTVSSVAPMRLEAYGLSIEYPGNYTTDEAGVGAEPPSGAEGVFTAWRESPLELDGVALYWVQDAVTWDLDAPDIAVWLGEVTEHDDLDATIVRSGTAAVFGTVAEYRLLTADLGLLRGDGAYAVAGAWFPSCQRSVLFAVFEERGALGSVEQRLGEYLASFRCDMPPQGA